MKFDGLILIQGMGNAAPKREPGKPFTSGDINKMFASADTQTALRGAAPKQKVLVYR